MKIQESSLQLSASHEASRVEQQEIATEQNFRRIFNHLADTSSDGQVAARQRVQQLLQSLIDAILAAMDGKKCTENFAAGSPAPLAGEAAPAAGGWRRSITETLSESERTCVSGRGCVKTGDGREIAFDYSLDLARDYRSTKTRLEGGERALRDPLVLSYPGRSCELGGERIAFDLDADGTPEQIPGLGAGSGFLVFDRNGNGRADDGSELFGTASGDGFADLARLDSDRNGWIDEADPAYAQLAVWSGDGFAGLRQRGIGALVTAAVDASFSLKTDANELLGQIRSAGIYLTEGGQAGALQQVDLAVSALPGRAQQPAERQHLAA